MLLLVNLEDGPYVADVGFGGLTLTGPLRLEPDVEQPTPHEPFRLLRRDSEFLMEAWFGGVWNTLYCFGLHGQLLPDYEVASWYLSNHPESKFVTSLIAARPDPDTRYALRNNSLTLHHRSGQTERYALESGASLRNALETHFRLVLPDTPALMEKLERIAAQESTTAGRV
jgi:N-hydroxyarylamine O-acetyltransferase